MTDEPFDYGPRDPKSNQYNDHPTKVFKKFVAPIRDTYIHTKCGAETIMRGDGLCETYATNPKFYGSTFCCGCRDYFLISEFVWVEHGRRTEIVLGTVAGEPGLDLRR